MKLCGNVYVCNRAETVSILQVMLKPDILSTTSLRCRISNTCQRRCRRSGPLFSGSLVSFSDCRDSLRTRRLCQVSCASLPLPCVYAYLVYNPSRFLPADQEPGAARPACFGTHALDFISSFHCRTLPVVDTPPRAHARVILFAVA